MLLLLTLLFTINFDGKGNPFLALYAFQYFKEKINVSLLYMLSTIIFEGRGNVFLVFFALFNINFEGRGNVFLAL